MREGEKIPDAQCLYCGNTQIRYFGQRQTVTDVYIPGERSLHKTPSGRTLGTSVCPQGPARCVLPQGPARCVLEVYVPRLITSPSS
jgi:hypothetical protein